jgi:hypothetical protein
MSAFIVGDNHIGAILRWYLMESHPAYRPQWRGLEPTAREAASMFTALARENWRSVSYRYGYVRRSEPTPVDDLQLTRFAELTPVEVIKACDCLNYQSCEHPTYEQSEAKRLINAIKSAAIGALPGYRAAAWEVTQTAEDREEGVAADV